MNDDSKSLLNRMEALNGPLTDVVTVSIRILPKKPDQDTNVLLYVARTLRAFVLAIIASIPVRAALWKVFTLTI